MNLLTVILLTHNRSHYLKFAIEAILNQTYKEFDFFIINKGSTDDTEAVISRYQDDRIRYEKYEADGKVPFKKMCHSKYLLITHDDDIMEPTMLERELQILESDEDIVAVSCAVKIINEENNLVEENWDAKVLLNNANDLLFDKNDYHHYYCKIHGQHIFHHPTVMTRKSVYDNLPSNSIVQAGNCGDIFQTLLLNELGKIYMINEPLYNYRIHNEQSSSDMLKYHQLVYKHIIPWLSDRVSEDEAYLIKKQFETCIFAGQMRKKLNSYLHEYKEIDLEHFDFDSLADNNENTDDTVFQIFFIGVLRRLKSLKQKFNNRTINYVIWGASDSGEDTKQIFDVFLPNFICKGFIDSYRKGTFLGHTIKSPEEYDFSLENYIVVAVSGAGTATVIAELEKRGLAMPDNFSLGYFISSPSLSRGK